ncbi:unnamed protein product [Sympodiomycopsis kandeliae]
MSSPIPIARVTRSSTALRKEAALQPPALSNNTNVVVEAPTRARKIILRLKPKSECRESSDASCQSSDEGEDLPLKKRRRPNVREGRQKAFDQRPAAPVGVFDTTPIAAQFAAFGGKALNIPNPWGWHPEQKDFLEQCEKLQHVDTLLSGCNVDTSLSTSTKESSKTLLKECIAQLQKYLATHTVQFKQIDCDQLLSRKQWTWIEADWEYLRHEILRLQRFRLLLPDEVYFTIHKVIAYTLG